jgi:sn-glycerol 3-phosphate transport system substrate-binding protein
MRTLLMSVVFFLSSTFAQVELEFQHSMNGPLGEAVTFIVDKYNEEKAGEVVVNETFVGSYEEGLQGALAQLAAGENPDILQLEVAMVARVAESGVLMNWKPLFEGDYAANYEAFWPVFREQISREDGNIYAIPFNNSNPVLYYNADMLEEAGVQPPTTYTELPEMAAKLKETFPDVVPIYFDAFPWVLEGAVWSNGGEMVGEEGLRMNEPEAVEVIQLWTDVIRAGNAAPVTQTAQEDFAAGKVAMTFGSVASRFFIERAVGDNFAWQAAPLPYFDEPQVPVGGANLMIFDNIAEEKKQAAIDFLIWVTQPEQQFDWIRLTNYVAVNQQATELPAFAEYLTTKPDLGIGIEQLPFSRPRPSRVGYPQATPEIVASLERIWLQNADVQTELDDLVARTARFFRE